MNPIENELREHGVRLSASLQSHVAALILQTDGIGSIPPDGHQNLAAAVDNLRHFLRGLKHQHGGEWREVSISLTPASLSDLTQKEPDELSDAILKAIERLAKPPTIPAAELLRALLLLIRARRETIVFSVKRRLREESLYPLWMHQSLALSQPLRSRPKHLGSSSFLATWAVRKLETTSQRSRRPKRPSRKPPHPKKAKRK